MAEHGGPSYDIVNDSSSSEMRNQLRPFDHFQLNMTQKIPQTLIRLPLRTSQQAKISKITKCEATAENIQQVLEGFGEEMRDGGLLFLKHIRKVILRTDETVLSVTEALEQVSKEDEYVEQPRTF